MKYWFTRIAAALFTMGSFAAGPLVGYEYGLWAGLASFIASLFIGIYLHKTADKMRNQMENEIEPTNEKAGFYNRMLTVLFILFNIISLFLFVQILAGFINRSLGGSLFIRAIFYAVLVLLFGIMYPSYRSSSLQEKHIFVGLSFLLMLLFSLSLFVIIRNPI